LKRCAGRRGRASVGFILSLRGFRVEMGVG
jgi:hypothetical protein